MRASRLPHYGETQALSPSTGPQAATPCFPQLSAHLLSPQATKEPHLHPGAPSPACGGLRRCENSSHRGGATVKEAVASRVLSLSWLLALHTLRLSPLQLCGCHTSWRHQVTQGHGHSRPNGTGGGSTQLALQSCHFNTGKKGLFPNGWEATLLPFHADTFLAFGGTREAPQGCSVTTWVLCIKARPATSQRKFPPSCFTCGTAGSLSRCAGLSPQGLSRGVCTDTPESLRAPSSQPTSQARRPPGPLCCACATGTRWGARL